MRDPMKLMQQLICTVLLCAAQSNFCMDAKLTAPNDGNEWIEIKSTGDLYKYQFDGKRDREWNLGKLAAVSLNARAFSDDIPNMCYACIKDSAIHILRPNIFPISIDWHKGIKESSPIFIRGLTLSEMKQIMKGTIVYSLCGSFVEEAAMDMENAIQHFDELAKKHVEDFEWMKKYYSTLCTLTRKEQRHYVLNNSGIVTLLGIRAKRQSPLSVIHKDAFTIVIRQLIALETERIGKEPLQLWTPKEKLPEKKEPVKEEFRCGIQ